VIELLSRPEMLCLSIAVASSDVVESIPVQCSVASFLALLEDV